MKVACEGVPPALVEPGSLLVKEKTAARMLSISPRTLWSLAASGAIPKIRVGARSVRYRVEDLSLWVASQAATRRSTSR